MAVKKESAINLAELKKRITDRFSDVNGVLSKDRLESRIKFITEKIKKDPKVFNIKKIKARKEIMQDLLKTIKN
jgi:hypothetical protein